MKYSVLALAVVWVLMGSNEASGESTMRCGNGLISLGDTKLDVISKCGAPDLKEVVGLDTIGVDFGTAFRASTSSVDAWHYNCGEGRFNNTLYFAGGKLTLIEMSDSRGSGPVRCG